MAFTPALCRSRFQEPRNRDLLSGLAVWNGPRGPTYFRSASVTGRTLICCASSPPSTGITIPVA